MKTAIGLAAAFVGVLALIARSSADAPKADGTKPVAAAVSAPALAPVVSTRSSRAVETRGVAPVAPPAEALQGSAQAPTPGLLTSRLDHELGLSASQRGRVEEIFRAREQQVGAIQKRVLQSGYFNPRETDPQLGRLREDSYVQISMLLDREQNRRFAEVLRKNTINDHMVISLPDSLVVLD